jgi:hypothetical protein
MQHIERFLLQNIKLMFDQHSFVIGKKYLFERKEGGVAASGISRKYANKSNLTLHTILRRGSERRMTHRRK